MVTTFDGAGNELFLSHNALALDPGDWIDPPSGMPDCADQDEPGNIACQATPICNLNGYCGSTAGSYSANYWSQLNNAFCGSIENNAFLTFVAMESSISFDVYVYNCYDSEAIQIMIFEANDCGSGPVTNLVCVNEMYAQNNAYSVSTSGLTPGEEYYIMIDGFGGDICDYTFVASDGVATPISAVSSLDDNFTICAGESITINAEGGLGSFSWTGEGLSTQTGPEVAITPPAIPGVYTYSIESEGNIGMCPGMTDYSFTITVEDCGCLAPPIYVNNLSICQNETVDLTDGIASNSSPDANPTFYATQNDAQNKVSQLTNTMVSTGGTYWIRVEDPDDESCFATYQIDVTETVLDFTATVVDESCGESNGKITVTPSGGTAPYSYNLNGLFSAPSNGAFEELESGTYTVSIIDDNGCETSQDVVVESVGAPAISAPNDSAICLGDEIVLTANNPDNANVSWSNNITDGVGFTPSAAGTTTYTVTATHNGCSATDQVTVTVHDLPNVEAGEDQTICEGANVVLTASGANSYQWDNGVNNGVAFSPELGVHQYTVVGTDVHGCQNTDALTITVVEPAEVSFEGDNLSGCKPHEVNFVNTTNANSVDCLWDFGDGNTANGCDSVSHTYQNSGFYDVSLTVTTVDGCVSSFTAEEYIEIIPSTVADFSADPMTASTFNTTVNFYNQSANASDYEWNFGDGTPIVTDANPTHAFTDEKGGEYIVTLVTTNGIQECNDTTKIIVIIQEETIFYVPNTFTPDNDTYNEVFKPIFDTGFDPYTYSLEIYNRWGEIIFESHDWNVGWDGSYGVSNNRIVKEGTYLWKIRVKENGKDKHNEYQGHITLLK